MKGGERILFRVSDDTREVVEFLAFCDYGLGRTAPLFREWIADKLGEETRCAVETPPINPQLIQGDTQYNLQLASDTLAAIDSKKEDDQSFQDILIRIIGEKIAEEAPNIRRVLEPITAKLEDSGRLGDVLMATNRLCPPDKDPPTG